MIPKDVPFDEAALYGCCITTGFGIIENDARVKPGESVLIMGTGGIGLVSVIAAKINGAQPIIAVDVHQHKLKLAKEYGATHTINSSSKDVTEAVKEILGTSQLDVVLENTGIAEMIELSYELCGHRGRTILVGVPNIQKKVRIDTLPLHFGKVLTGSHGGGSKPNLDIPRLLKLQKEGKFNLSQLVSHRYSLDEINQAISDLRQGRVIRPMIYIN